MQKLRVKGHPHYRKREISIRFEPDTFDEIVQLAAVDGISFNEQVRMLVEWGLESSKQREERNVIR